MEGKYPSCPPWDNSGVHVAGSPSTPSGLHLPNMCLGLPPAGHALPGLLCQDGTWDYPGLDPGLRSCLLVEGRRRRGQVGKRRGVCPQEANQSESSPGNEHGRKGSSCNRRGHLLQMLKPPPAISPLL